MCVVQAVSNIRNTGARARSIYILKILYQLYQSLIL